MYSFPNLEPVHCSLSGSHVCFLTCIQVSQEADQVVWYSHLFNNFPQFAVIHTIKDFGIVSKAEVDEIRYSPRLIGWLLWWLRWQSLPTMWETWVQSLGQEDPLEKRMAIHSTILAWRILWTVEPGGLQSIG